jgi:serine/threonine protein phosphatase PrpC
VREPAVDAERRRRAACAANMVGIGAVAPAVARVRLLDTERLLLCSDGLHGAVNDVDIAQHAEGFHSKWQSTR